jgi:hypothetical protein
VLVPKGKIDDVDYYIGEVMERYNENIDVPEYERPCYCIGKKAELDSQATASEIVGSIDKIRDRFHKEIKPKVLKEMELESENKRTEQYIKANSKKIRASEKRLDKEWEKELKPFNIEVQQALDLHPLKDKPDPDCTDCKGKGIMKSQYNPNSKWDWYEIGGRWNGYLTDNGYEDNLLANNSLTVKEMLDKFEEKNGIFAFINSNGKWYEEGVMGWWGISTENKPDWEQILKKLLEEEDPENFVVCIDCHI